MAADKKTHKNIIMQNEKFKYLWGKFLMLTVAVLSSMRDNVSMVVVTEWENFGLRKNRLTQRERKISSLFDFDIISQNFVYVYFRSSISDIPKKHTHTHIYIKGEMNDKNCYCFCASKFLLCLFNNGKSFLFIVLYNPSLFPYLPFDNVSQALYELQIWKKVYCLSIETLNVSKELFFLTVTICKSFLGF